ncbi:MAG: hypothetical protein D6797_03715, partial [Bdellovibrio sp.]
RITDNIYQEVEAFLGKVIEARLSPSQSLAVRGFLRLSKEFEAMADKCRLVVHKMRDLEKRGFNKEELLLIREAAEEALFDYEMVFSEIASDGVLDKKSQERLEKFNEATFTMEMTFAPFKSFFSRGTNKSQKEGVLEALVGLSQIRLHTQNIYQVLQGFKRS